jgi:hypothetical protein
MWGGALARHVPNVQQYLGLDESDYRLHHID